MRIIPLAGCALIFWCPYATGQENHSISPVSDVVEQEALKVLNDSDWAHTVKPSLQDTPCTYQNPAFPPSEKTAALYAVSPALRSDPVKADDSEYLIRFQSAKPVQTAVQELLAIGEKWSAYSARTLHVREDVGPTDVASGRYNFADMITIAVILKRSGPDGTTLFNYGYLDIDNVRVFPNPYNFRVGECAGLRTSNGEVFARAVLEAFGKSKALQISFPRLIEGKPLISRAREKVEFRMVADHRVFETTFYINASDVLDGSEQILYLPSAFTDSNQTPQQ